MSILFVRIAAALCFLAVALGAFGAHALKSTIESRGMLDVWNKAVLYHFFHAIALLVLALFGATNRGAWWLLFAGRTGTAVSPTVQRTTTQERVKSDVHTSSRGSV